MVHNKAFNNANKKDHDDDAKVERDVGVKIAANVQDENQNKQDVQESKDAEIFPENSTIIEDILKVAVDVSLPENPADDPVSQLNGHVSSDVESSGFSTVNEFIFPLDTRLMSAYQDEFDGNDKYIRHAEGKDAFSSYASQSYHSDNGIDLISHAPVVVNEQAASVQATQAPEDTNALYAAIGLQNASVSMQDYESGAHSISGFAKGGNGNGNGKKDSDVNTINGKNSDDYLEGTDSVDEISGRKGDDALFGYDGDDILYGEDGNDILNGGAGWDILIGGEGADEFVFDAIYANSFDTIKDFNAEEGDLLNVFDIINFDGDDNVLISDYIQFRTDSSNNIEIWANEDGLGDDFFKIAVIADGYEQHGKVNNGGVSGIQEDMEAASAIDVTLL